MCFLRNHFPETQSSLPAINEFLQLPFHFRENLEQLSAYPARETMFLSDGQVFARHIFGDAAIGGLSVLVQSVISQRPATDDRYVRPPSQVAG